jgi:glycosyltransferase involved in cell wall biosynthesis
MNRKTRIAVLGCRGIPARYGGFETFAEELSVRLVEMGYQVDVFCESDHPAQDGEYKGVGLIFTKRFRLGPLSTIFYDVASFYKARKSYEIVYMLGYGAAFFAFVPRLWGRKVWINMDGVEWARSKWSYPARLWFKAMEWTAMRMASRVIADADGIRDHLGKRHGKRHPCSVIAYGAYPLSTEPDPGLLRRWGLTSGGYYLVVCRLEPENNVLEIIRGFAASKSRRRLIIVGDNKATNPYVSELTSVQDGRVAFIGTVFEKDALASLRSHSFAYFHGHSVGGTNPSLLEAMGCANLVLAHDNAFNREVLGGTGLFFANQAEIPEIIDKVEDFKFEPATLKSAAKGRIRESYSWEKISSEYAALISSELGSEAHVPTAPRVRAVTVSG